MLWFHSLVSVYNVPARVLLMCSPTTVNVQRLTFTLARHCWQRYSGNYTLSILLVKKWGLKAEFYDNAYFEGNPLIQRIDRVVNYTWSFGPITRQNRDYVSARWSGKFRPLHTEM